MSCTTYRCLLDPSSSKMLQESTIQSNSRKYSQNTWSWMFYFSTGHVITYFINYVILANLKFMVFLFNFSFLSNNFHVF